MENKGPYREIPNQDAENLEKMEKEISNKDVVGIKLDKNIKEGDLVPLFREALGSKIKPEDIVFYSIATGILKYQSHEANELHEIDYYRYINQTNPHINLTVKVQRKESLPAAISSLSTKAEVEAKTEERENWSKENRKNNLIRSMNLFEQYIQHTKELVEKGVDKELEETYLTELKAKRTSLKLLLDTIDDKLEEKK